MFENILSKGNFIKKYVYFSIYINILLTQYITGECTVPRHVRLSIPITYPPTIQSVVEKFNQITQYYLKIPVKYSHKNQYFSF